MTGLTKVKNREATGLRKIPQNVLRKMVTLVLWIRGRSDRIEENSSKVFKENGSFSILDLSMDHWPWMPELRSIFLSLMYEEI